MIDLQIIQGAQLIRREYLDVISQVDEYQKLLKELHDFLNKKLDDLKRIHDNEFKNKATKEEIYRVTNLIVKEIEEIEIKEKRLAKKFETMNDKLESLKKEEQVLYESIKERYPKLTDQEIKSELAKYLDE